MFHYEATVVRVVDGDTLYLDIDLGFYIRMVIDVRLNGVNTPELRGAERERGLEAKAYVEKTVPAGSRVLARTYKVEKYGRYLADIWYLPGSADREEIQGKGRLLNQELLEKGLAIPYNP